MPNNIVTSFAQKTGKSEDEVEKLWDTAKKQAKKQGKSKDDDDFYPYVTGILKKMLNMSEVDEAKNNLKSFSAVIKEVKEHKEHKKYKEHKQE